MKKFVILMLVAMMMAMSLSSYAVVGNLVIVDGTNGVTPEIMVQTILGEELPVSNITFKGTTSSAGTFTGGTDIIGFESGIVLSSGKAKDAEGPNLSDSNTTVLGIAGDTDLDTLTTYSTNDATVLEFDFVPDTDNLYFEYVFTSEEFNEFVNSIYNDVFGFFVNGTNVALLPDGVTTVSINNVNLLTNSEYYINNDLQDGGGDINTEMDGLTVVLSVNASVIPQQLNHIKLAIADTGDSSFDSNVFIKAGSFAANRPPVADAGSDVTDYATSIDGLTLTLDGTGSYDPEGDPLTYTWSTGSSILTGATPTITLPVGVHHIVLYVNDGIATSTDVVTITVEEGYKDTELTVSATSVQYSDKMVLTATLTSEGSPLVNKPVRFTYGSIPTGFVTTDINGVAKFTTFNINPEGLYNVTAEFLGEDSPELLNPSTASTTVLMTLEDATISYTGDYTIPVGTPLSLSALVEQADDGTKGNLTYTDVQLTVSTTDMEGNTTVVIDETLDVDLSGVASKLATLTPNVYNVTVSIIGNGYYTSATDTAMIVVYDPNGGFVTGGGHYTIVDASEGDLGKANFGFVAKHKKGVPTGNFEFHYKDGNLNLDSDTISWLTVSNINASFEGTGTVDGNNVTFRVQVTDNKLLGKEDKITIKIWEGTDTEADPIYKAINQSVSGNIVVHNK